MARGVAERVAGPQQPDRLVAHRRRRPGARLAGQQVERVPVRALALGGRGQQVHDVERRHVGPGGGLEPGSHLREGTGRRKRPSRRSRRPRRSRDEAAAPIDCAPAAPAIARGDLLSFDVHQLDTFVLVGSAVTLLAILAVRFSSRAGLPSLLVYLLMGVALGESGSRHPLRERRAGPLAGLRGAGDHPGRGRPDDPLERGTPLDAARALAGHDRRVASRSRWWRSPATTCSGCRGSSRCCSARSPHRRTRPRCSRCCAWCPLPRRLIGALEAESGLNDAPTVVLVTLISTGAVDRPRAAGHGRDRGLRAGRRHRVRPALRVRRRLGDAPRGAAVLGPLPARGADADVPGVRRRRDRRTAPASPRCTSPRWCWATWSCPTAPATRSFAEGVAWLAQIGLFVMLGLLLSPARISLSTVGLGAGGRAGADLRGPAGVGGRQHGGAADVVARAVVPVLGRAARRGADRADDDPAGRGGAGRHPPVRPGLRHGRDLHAADRPDPAAGGAPAQGRPALRAAWDWRWRPRRWSGSRPTCCRSRSARSRGCTGSRWASSGCPGRVGEHGDPGRRDPRARASHGAAARRRPARRHAAPAP